MSKSNHSDHEPTPAAQVPNFLGFEEITGEPAHDHAAHSHAGHSHGAPQQGQDTSAGHKHGVLEPHEVHMHLVLREANRAAVEGEMVPLGRFPVIILVPDADGDGNPTLAIDTTGMTPGQAHEILATATSVLGAAIAEGAIDAAHQPLPASQAPDVPFQPSLN